MTKPRTKEKISITIDKDLIEEVDNFRGLAGRSAVINDILRVAFMPEDMWERIEQMGQI